MKTAKLIDHFQVVFGMGHTRGLDGRRTGFSKRWRETIFSVEHLKKQNQ
jgi:hypothetical protein